MYTSLFNKIKLTVLLLVFAFTLRAQIPVNIGFDILGNVPIDQRFTIPTLPDTSTISWPYHGLYTHVQDIDQLWWYDGTKWSQFTTVSSGLDNFYLSNDTLYAVSPDSTFSVVLHPAVTLNTTSYDYLSLTDQEITLGAIDGSTDIINGGSISVTNPAGGTNTIQAALDSLYKDNLLNFYFSNDTLYAVSPDSTYAVFLPYVKTNLMDSLPQASIILDANANELSIFGAGSSDTRMDLLDEYAQIGNSSLGGSQSWFRAYQDSLYSFYTDGAGTISDFLAAPDSLRWRQVLLTDDYRLSLSSNGFGFAKIGITTENYYFPQTSPTATSFLGDSNGDRTLEWLDYSVFAQTGDVRLDTLSYSNGVLSVSILDDGLPADTTFISNIYVADGQLTGNRILDANSNRLTFQDFYFVPAGLGTESLSFGNSNIPIFRPQDLISMAPDFDTTTAIVGTTYRADLGILGFDTYTGMILDSIPGGKLQLPSIGLSQWVESGGKSLSGSSAHINPFGYYSWFTDPGNFFNKGRISNNGGDILMIASELLPDTQSIQMSLYSDSLAISTSTTYSGTYTYTNRLAIKSNGEIYIRNIPYATPDSLLALTSLDKVVNLAFGDIPVTNNYGGTNLLQPALDSLYANLASLPGGHDAVTLNTTSYDYLSLSGQEITLGGIEASTDILNGGSLPVTNPITGTNTLQASLDSLYNYATPDGNGIISALPVGNVTIDALTNNLTINNANNITFSTNTGVVNQFTDTNNDAYALSVASQGAQMSSLQDLTSITNSITVDTGGISLEVSTGDLAFNIFSLPRTTQDSILYIDGNDRIYKGPASGAGSGVEQLSDLNDVISATNTNRFVLVANGTTGYEGRALTEADISDLQSYLTTAITSLNGETGSTQTFVTGTTGTDFNIVSGSGIHTFNIPSASTTNRGLVTTGTQSFTGIKKFGSPVGIGSATYTPAFELELYDDVTAPIMQAGGASVNSPFIAFGNDISWRIQSPDNTGGFGVSGFQAAGSRPAILLNGYHGNTSLPLSSGDGIIELHGYISDGGFGFSNAGDDDVLVAFYKGSLLQSLYIMGDGQVYHDSDPGYVAADSLALTNKKYVDQAISDSLGTIPGGHDPVTLAASATTGGLSLSTQEIGFQPATSGQNGYLTSTDWTNFNNHTVDFNLGDDNLSLSADRTVTGGGNTLSITGVGASNVGSLLMGDASVSLNYALGTVISTFSLTSTSSGLAVVDVVSGSGQIAVTSDSTYIDHDLVGNNANAFMSLMDSGLRLGVDSTSGTDFWYMFPYSTPSANQVLTDTNGDFILEWSDVSSLTSTQLSDLTDVNTSTPTNRNVLVADGLDWESRPLTEADISDLSHTVNTDSQDLGFTASTGEVTITGGNNTTIGNFGTTNTNYGFVVGSNNAVGSYLNSDGTWDDFDTDVSANSDVAANTAARHDAVTLTGTPDYITITGQQITRNQINLTTDVTGVLPDANVADNITITNISQVQDITASASELNLLDLAGLSTGWVLKATGATTAAWGQLNTSDLNNDSGWTSGDNLGNHTLTQNMIGGSFWYSGDGGSEGITIGTTGTVSTSGLLRINNADPVGIAIIQNSLTLVDNQNAIAGATFQNLNTGASADMRFAAANDQGDYLAFFSPGSGNTQTLFGQTRSNVAGFFLNGVTDTDKQLAIGTIHTGDIIFGIGNSEISRMTLNNFTYGNYDFDTDQSLGAGQNNYVFTYNNGTGQGSFTTGANIPVTNPLGGTNTLQASLDSLNASGGGDGNGIISALPLGDVTVTSANTLKIQNSSTVDAEYPFEVERDYGASTASFPIKIATFRNTTNTTTSLGYQSEAHIGLDVTGTSSTNTHRRYIKYSTNNADNWYQGVNGGNTYIMYDVDNAHHWMWLESSTGEGYLNSVGSSAIRINNQASTGTGGFRVGNGTTSTVFTVDGSTGHSGFGLDAGVNSRYIVNINDDFNNTDAGSVGGLLVDVVHSAVTPSSGGPIGMNMTVTSGGGATFPYSSGWVLDVAHSGAGVLTTQTGLDLTLRNNSSVNLTQAYGINIKLVEGSTGTNVSSHGIYIPSATGSHNNIYGIRILDQTANTLAIGVRSGLSAGTNKWNFYADPGADNYFGGNVGIKDATPDAALDIAGTMRLDGAFTDASGDVGSSGQVLTSTVTGTNWLSAGSLTVTNPLGGTNTLQAALDSLDANLGAGDNLGNHLATEDLDIAGFNIVNVDTLKSQAVENLVLGVQNVNDSVFMNTRHLIFTDPLAATGQIILYGESGFNISMAGELTTWLANDVVFNGKHIQAGFGLGVRNNRGNILGIDLGGITNSLGLYANSTEVIRLNPTGEAEIRGGQLQAEQGILVEDGSTFEIQDSTGSHPSKTIVINRVVTTTAGDWVEIGNITFGSNNGGIIEFDIGTSASGFAASARYVISTQYNNSLQAGGSNVWLECIPVNGILAYQNFTEYITLDVKTNTSTNSFRLRRKVNGTFSSSETIRMKITGVGATFTPAANTGTGGTVSDYYHTTVISQVQNRLGVNTPQPSVALDVTGAINATDVIKAGDGTVSNPGLGFDSDANTGIYRIGADDMGFTTNSTLRMSIDANSIDFNQYGLGNKEAADLSVTASNFLAAFSTTGEVIELNKNTLYPYILGEDATSSTIQPDTLKVITGETIGSDYALNARTSGDSLILRFFPAGLSPMPGAVADVANDELIVIDVSETPDKPKRIDIQDMLGGATATSSPSNAATVDFDVNGRMGGKLKINMTSVTSGITMTFSNFVDGGDYLLYFTNVSGTDTITLPSGCILLKGDGSTVASVDITENDYFYITYDGTNYYFR